MWLSLFIALITYLLSPNDTAKERRQALLRAGLAGGATYLATEHTEWGNDLSTKFDSAIDITPEQTAEVGAPLTKPPVTAVNSGSTSLWDKVKDYVPTALAVGAGAAIGGSSRLPLYIGAALLGYLILNSNSGSSRVEVVSVPKS